MAVCERCGCTYSGRGKHQEFVDWLLEEGWSNLMDEALRYYSFSCCFECNKENLFDNVKEYSTCDECSHIFHQDDDEEAFEDFLGEELGYSGDLLYEAKRHYQDFLCLDCNKKWFKDIQDEFEDENVPVASDAETGEYRSWHGGTVDGCDDALWAQGDE